MAAARKWRRVKAEGLVVIMTPLSGRAGVRYTGKPGMRLSLLYAAVKGSRRGEGSTWLRPGRWRSEPV